MVDEKIISVQFIKYGCCGVAVLGRKDNEFVELRDVSEEVIRSGSLE